MRGLVGAAVVVAACGGSTRSSAPVTNTGDPEVGKLTPVESFPRIALSRPELSVEHLVPDFHEELRWPLSAMAHPELEPQFEIANVFAMPGIGWIELCERGVQNRVQSGRNRDELEYLRGWCSAIKGDADSACGKLKPLLTSTVSGMSDAVRSDLANIMANAGDLDAVDKLLNKHRIDDTEVFDILTATFVELGRERDAFEMNRRAMDAVGHTKASTHCRRLARSIALGDSSETAKRSLEDLATKAKTPDETCVALWHQVECSLGPAANCFAYFKSEGINTNTTFLLAAYRAWPKQPAGYVNWLAVVNEAVYASDVDGAKLLAEPSLDAAMRTAPSCEPRVLRVMKLYNKAWPDERIRAELVRCHWDPDSYAVKPATTPPAPPAPAPSGPPLIPPSWTEESIDDKASELPSAKKP